MGDVVVLALAILVLVAIGAVASVTVVKPHESIVIFRLGKATSDSVRGPGLQLVLPVVERAMRVDGRETATHGTVAGTSKDDVAVTADITILWRVVDPLKSVLNVANVEQALNDIARTTLLDLDADHAIAHPGRAADAIEERANEAGKRWGVEIAEVRVRRVSRA